MELYIIIILLSIPITTLASITIGRVRLKIEEKVTEKQIKQLELEMIEHRRLAQRYEVEINRKRRELVKLREPLYLSTSVGNCSSVT